MRPGFPDHRLPRRGLTLLEMLVAVALLVLMMTIVTSIFAAATGAMSAAKTYQDLDGELRQLDSVLRQDLAGATADTGNGPLTPPFDPDLGLGYFEVGENQFADLQQEDSDDYLRFTSRAPEGQFFTGRMWVGPLYLPSGYPNQPVMIQSNVAEIIYFLRNQKLYRRVFLVAPERQAAVNAVAPASKLTACPTSFPALAFGWTSNTPVYGSWLGMNDLSARPSTVIGNAPILNTLGDLTNRENRMFYPRFSNDYLTNNGPGTAAAAPPDSAWDDVNQVSGLTNTGEPIAGAMPGDSVPDWWPTLYSNVFSTALLNPHQYFPRQTPFSQPQFVDLMAFPYVFPWAYSVDAGSSTNQGALHSMGPSLTSGIPIVNGSAMSSPPSPAPQPYGYIYSNGGIAYQRPTGFSFVPPNHNPVSTGDSLTLPGATNTLQTWWGFPTWKETMSPNWLDPVYTLAGGTPTQPATGSQFVGLSWTARNKAGQNAGLLPALTGTFDTQPYTDSAGGTTFSTTDVVFRDDLIMEGVRSFDVKVYDNAVPGYVDLGYSNYVTGASSAAQAAALLATMGHEGRIPPLVADNRNDPNYGIPIGDDTVGITRLRRVWDTWSTDYSNAPAPALLRVAPSGPDLVMGPPMTMAAYPSYPPPYPVPLRGVQIQIRVVDPRNERIKMLTIRHSFSN